MILVVGGQAKVAVEIRTRLARCSRANDDRDAVSFGDGEKLAACAFEGLLDHLRNRRLDILGVERFEGDDKRLKSIN